jgi:hypothetical protein
VDTTEQAALDRAVAKANHEAGALQMLIRTRAREIGQEPTPVDQSVAREAIRDAETRLCWAQWHRGQAARHRATLEGLIAHHESAADRLEGRMV